MFMFTILFALARAIEAHQAAEFEAFGLDQAEAWASWYREALAGDGLVVRFTTEDVNGWGCFVTSVSRPERGSFACFPYPEAWLDARSCA